MEAVLKVGGSLAEDPASLVKLCQKLGELAKVHRIVVVPGGGKFADAVRDFDRSFGLSETVAHNLAILAMDQYGVFLSDIAPSVHVSSVLDEACDTPNDVLPIFLPSKLMFSRNPLEHSWDVTSDSISAYIAAVLHAEKLILVTDVDGVFFEDPKKNKDVTCIEELSVEELNDWNRRTCVDITLPKILRVTKLDCYVVNGKYPERIKDILENKKTVCTHLTF